MRFIGRTDRSRVFSIGVLRQRQLREPERARLAHKREGQRRLPRARLAGGATVFRFENVLSLARLAARAGGAARRVEHELARGVSADTTVSRVLAVAPGGGGGGRGVAQSRETRAKLPALPQGSFQTVELARRAPVSRLSASRLEREREREGLSEGYRRARVREREGIRGRALGRVHGAKDERARLTLCAPFQRTSQNFSPKRRARERGFVSIHHKASRETPRAPRRWSHAACWVIAA